MFYDYKCVCCGFVEEIEHGMLEEKKYDCPYCAVAMKKVITGGAGVHYKGIGFYGNKSIDSPRAKHAYVKELVGPSFLKGTIKKR
jgi:predicted nucleic acid-binding Zn ribbon protein